jgi:hypothetical protein
MRRVCARLSALGIDLASRDALEFFAREGDWQTVSYAREVARLDVWEIDPGFESALRENLPRARVRIGNSFELAAEEEFAGQFDFIVFDNPQGIFGEKDRYCEHFEALETVPRLMKPEAVVIFNVNREPFDYERFPAWQLRRNRFYARDQTSRLDEGFLMDFYRRYFEARGIEVRQAFIEPRHDRYLVYFVAALVKQSR